jgi:hypothetical protein
MALPDCLRCGKTNPRRMIGLMTVFFGEYVELPPEPGYFYLCPKCYEAEVEPHLDDDAHEAIRASLQLSEERTGEAGDRPAKDRKVIRKLTE